MVIDMKKQNVFLIIQSLLCVLLALLLAGAVICLYQEGVSLKAEDPSAWIFTREAVAERLRPVIPVLILTIAVHSSIVAAIDPAERVVQKDWIIPFAVDTADDMAWRIEGGSSLLPQTIVLNRDGVVVYNREGSVTPEVLATLYAQAALDQ